VCKNTRGEWLCTHNLTWICRSNSLTDKLQCIPVAFIPSNIILNQSCFILSSTWSTIRAYYVLYCFIVSYFAWLPNLFIHLTSGIVWQSSWGSWSIDAWMARHLSTSPFTASHFSARDISVPLIEIYCTYHVIDSTPMAAPGFCHCWSVYLEQSSRPCPQSKLHQSCFHAPAKDILFARYQHIRGICLL